MDTTLSVVPVPGAAEAGAVDALLRGGAPAGTERHLRQLVEPLGGPRRENFGGLVGLHIGRVEMLLEMTRNLPDASQAQTLVDACRMICTLVLEVMERRAFDLDVVVEAGRMVDAAIAMREGFGDNTTAADRGRLHAIGWAAMHELASRPAVQLQAAMRSQYPQSELGRPTPSLHTQLFGAGVRDLSRVHRAGYFESMLAGDLNGADSLLLHLSATVLPGGHRIDLRRERAIYDAAHRPETLQPPALAALLGEIHGLIEQEVQRYHREGRQEAAEILGVLLRRCAGQPDRPVQGEGAAEFF